jgi:hypothetical protein
MIESNEQLIFIIFQSVSSKHIYLFYIFNMTADSRTTHYPKLQSREDWQTWIDSIADLATSYDVWKYCDPDAAKQPEVVTDDTGRTGLRKVNERITLTIHQKYQVLYAGIRTPQGKIQALRDVI